MGKKSRTRTREGTTRRGDARRKVEGVPLVVGTGLDVDEDVDAFKIEGEDACLVVMELEVEDMGNST